MYNRSGQQGEARMKKYMKNKAAPYRKRQNETRDCSVIAVAIVARMTYKEAHTAMKEAGRRDKRGAHTHTSVYAIRKAGFSVKEVKNMKQKNGSKYTPKTIGKKFKKGYYICVVDGHIFAVVNGIVEDWTDGRQHHITDAYKVVRTRK